MLELWMKRNVLLFGIGFFAGLGAVSELLFSALLAGLVKDMERDGRGRFLKGLRQRYGVLTRTEGVRPDVRAFLERSLGQYRFLGRSLHGWQRLGQCCPVIALFLGAAGWYLAGMLQLGAEVQRMYLGGAVLSVLVGAAGSFLADARYRRDYLLAGLEDFLVNGAVGAAKEERAGVIRPETAPEKRQTAQPLSESRAEREKRELRTSLMRSRTSLKETAAASERERRAEILKNMDPGEQERIIREVLQEIFS